MWQKSILAALSLLLSVQIQAQIQQEFRQEIQEEFQEGPQDCVHWSDFSSLGMTDMRIQGTSNYSELSLQGQLVYRPLIENEDYYWLGLQLYQPEITLNGEDVNEPVYSIPFAVKLDKEKNNILDYVFNAPIKFADRSKLQGIYNALHIQKPYSGSDPASYVVEDEDDLGTFEVAYKVKDNTTDKRRIRYKTLGLTATSNAAIEVEGVDVHKDQTRFWSDSCWHRKVEAQSDIDVFTKDDFMRVSVQQQFDLQLRKDPPPLDARLLNLPLDPANWEMLSEDYVYPKPERRPEATGDEFLDKLARLDLANMNSEAILQFLYDNDEYLPLLKSLIWSETYEDKFEQRLFLMIGKTDSPNAHWLLAEIYTDESFNGDARFRSLMALKYAEKPIATELIDQIFIYSMQPLSSKNAELASSALMVLGIIANNQLDQNFGRNLSNRLATELRGNTDRQQSAALLTALGNAGDQTQQHLVENYLSHNDKILRERSAEALAHMPNERSLSLISNQLVREPEPRVQSAMLQGMGANKLNSNQLNQVYSFAAGSESKDVRRAAIQALTKQIETTPEVTTELRKLIKTEKNRGNLQEILRALY